jgi:hypothetical protein
VNVSVLAELFWMSIPVRDGLAGTAAISAVLPIDNV